MRDARITSINGESLFDLISELILLLDAGSVLNGGDTALPPTATHSMWADMIDGFQQSAMSTRLGIPILYGADAVHGHSNASGTTVFPHNIGLGAAKYKCSICIPYLSVIIFVYMSPLMK